MRFRAAMICALTLLTCRLMAGGAADEIAALIAPANLALMKGESAIPQLQTCVYWLETARRAGGKPEDVAATAVKTAGYKGGAAKLTAEHLTLSLAMADRLGCLDDAGLAELKRGAFPLIRKGPDAGARLGLGHVISPVFSPELRTVVCNVELTPIPAEEVKVLKVGPRQRALAADLRVTGLLSEEGYKSVLAARQPVSLSAGVLGTNPKGIPPQSPRLRRGTSLYLGWTLVHLTNLNEVAPPVQEPPPQPHRG